MIRCPKCGKISHNPNDERERYCGNCHKFHDQMDMRTCDCPIAFADDPKMAMQVHRYDCPLLNAEKTHA